MNRSRMLWFWALALVVVALDQATKAWVRAEFLELESRPVIEGWLSWTHVHNHGAAWGVLSGQRWLLVGVATLVIVAVASAARDIGARSPWANAGLALVLGGAIGNLIDRAWQGYVTDFVDLGSPWRWLREFPVWNVADAALTIGVGLLALALLRPVPVRPPAPAVPTLAGKGEARE